MAPRGELCGALVISSTMGAPVVAALLPPPPNPREGFRGTDSTHFSTKPFFKDSCGASFTQHLPWGRSVCCTRCLLP